MITLSRTSWRNVCAIQEMIVTRFPEAIAPGSDTSAMIANAIAHHIVPTALVILPPGSLQCSIDPLHPIHLLEWFSADISRRTPVLPPAPRRAGRTCHLGAIIA